VSRIVIDLKAGQPAKIFFETFADDEKMIEAVDLLVADLEPASTT